MRTEANTIEEINALLLEAEIEAATTEVRYSAEEVHEKSMKIIQNAMRALNV